MQYKDFFAGKRVTLMGLGLLGRGAGDAEFLAPLCKELVVTDLKSEAELAPSLARLQKFSNIRYALGAHKKEDFTDTDMVIKAAGVPLDSPYIAAARAAGVAVYMSTALFAQFAREAGAILVGVTGTRGKSTVSSLIYHTVAQSGRPAHLAGNIRGLSSLALTPKIKAGDIVVMELDSWQLQGFGDLKLSPEIAVFTNLMPDHLNYYGGDMEKYFTDKVNIFKYQAEPKIIAGGAIAERIPNVVVASPLPPNWRLKIIGDHNKENAALAAEALRMIGLGEPDIKKGIESFEPVEGRLQFVRELNGIKIYNDNNATTPEATLAALRALEPQKTILIAGGADKGLPLDELVAAMQTCKGVFLLEGTGTDRLKNDLQKTTIYRSVAGAVKDALALTVPGDAVLFSPGFASFGLFKNEYDRNDQFVAAVQTL
ncbi:UDP-N-acetylmuramoyl-L-alanine--D-glutamate ligase [Candidatus Kaiserbacteria bacterium]|nr:UDP-N-acetylmuramoyl-L-alanine--D-glutamate ligase [Candidatus Kaiserbacteria bacterium]